MIRLADPEDWPLIESWRNAHLSDMQTRMSVPREVTKQQGFEDAVWLVSLHANVPVAALSFTQDDEQRIRWVHDLYAAQGHALAGYKLSAWFERYCDETDYEIRGCTDPENTKYLEVVQLRGYELTSVQFRRRRRTDRIEPKTPEVVHTGRPAEQAEASFVFSGRFVKHRVPQQRRRSERESPSADSTEYRAGYRANPKLD